MIRALSGGYRVAAILVALSLLLVSAGNVFAHARFDRAEPPLDVAFDGTPVVLKAYFTQELTSKSTIQVLDANGIQVDLGDGHVDLDDPIRKTMLISLPELPVGIYTIDFLAESAEDGHPEPGTVTFGVGMLPPSTSAPIEEPAADDLTTEHTGESPNMALPYAY